MTPRRFKCSGFPKGTFGFNFECINLLQNDFCKQGYITLNATISGQDRIYAKTHLCRTFFAEYIYIYINLIYHYIPMGHQDECNINREGLLTLGIAVISIGRV